MWQRIKRFCVEGYELFKVFLQTMHAFWRFTKLHEPMVTIFGGALVAGESEFNKKAFELAHKLMHANITVLTGGGAGIMHAASCGAVPHEKGEIRSVGIGVTKFSERRNECVQEYIELSYFFTRKLLLIRFSSAFIVFPGGLGTLDELTEILQLFDAHELGRVPIVLVGVEYWDYFMKWVKQSSEKDGLISKDEMELFIITDDIETVFSLVRDECLRSAQQKIN